MGPLLVVAARKHAWSTVLVDSFCVVTISGFSLLHLLPECAEQAGWLALPLALVGFLAPTLAEALAAAAEIKRDLGIPGAGDLAKLVG